MPAHKTTWFVHRCRTCREVGKVQILDVPIDAEAMREIAAAHHARPGHSDMDVKVVTSFVFGIPKAVLAETWDRIEAVRNNI